MSGEPYPILEFDDAREAVIEPSRVVARRDIPQHAVLCFDIRVIRELPLRHGAEPVAQLASSLGSHDVWRLELDGRPFVALHPGLGGPFAAGFLEESIALGCRKFVACGTAGVLDSAIGRGHLIVPTSAVRDEGTSYHYLPPSREVEPSPDALKAILETLDEHDVPYVLAKTWTTDAFYRETRQRAARRAAEGCLTVEMEAASIFAVGRFRGVPVGQILSAADDLAGSEWDPRHDQAGGHLEVAFWLAAEACLRMG